MNLDRRHFLIMLPAAAIAWKYVLAGTPEESPNYKMTDHWWSMLIDIPKCIGCGNCVRACAAENDVPDGHFRTWVERYHVTDWHMESPEVISPDGGKEGFPAVARSAGGHRRSGLRGVAARCRRRGTVPARGICVAVLGSVVGEADGDAP